MNTWRLLLYGFAAFLSVRALVSLISRHQRYYIQQRLYDEEAKALEAERETKAALKVESKKTNDNMARRAAELEKEAATARAVLQAQATARAAAEEAMLAEDFASMGSRKNKAA